MKKESFAQEVEPIIREAGKILLSYFGKHLERNSKPNAGYYSLADIESEQYLIKNLQKILPQASILAEESGQNGLNQDLCWVIDPLDGTANFVHGIPYFSISIALTENGVPIFGMIYNPILDELFWAQKGKGAFLNGYSIRVSDARSLDICLASSCLPYDETQHDRLLHDFGKIAKRIDGIRKMGSAALDGCYVACGRFDALFFERLSWWDVAAVVIIIEEAGGRVVTYAGEPVRADFTSFVAANESVAKQFLEVLKEK
ncbi:MAG: Inositol-1(Or 4)-monophosphatase [candidate division TM6 bacterium GW2011_GWF2_32_72]|nr:MAG: Inositol-1(Or 4)-monophosphatase [candidate division TM6 bacterium GW2011_GWF2_32_72]